MKPYYQENGITIYHGDCAVVMPEITDVDLVLSDPQYGIGFNTQTKRSQKSGLAWGHRGPVDVSRDPGWVPLRNGDKTPFDPSPFLRFPAIILWGANNYSDKLPNSRGWLIWDKLGNMASCDFGDAELAWTSFNMSIRIWRQAWRGLVREGEDNIASRGPKLHPCQKPIELMRWCLGFSKTCGVVLDPQMGSGTTLRAAKDLGRPAIGIEIEERYCEVAARRMQQEVLQLG